MHVVATGRSAYPDVSVFCDRLAHPEVDPTVLCEVLSPTTEADDRGEKWGHYQQMASLRHYVLVSQHRPRVEVFTRTDLGWHYAEVLAGGAVSLSALSVTISLDAIYATRLDR